MILSEHPEVVKRYNSIMCGRYTLAIEAKSDTKLMGYFGNDPSKIPIIPKAIDA